MGGGEGHGYRSEDDPKGFSAARSGPHRPADGGGGAGCAGRHLEAQRAVSAGRIPLHLLLGDGCDRAQPLPAGGGLSARQPGPCGLYRQQDGRRRTCQPPVLDADRATRLLGQRGCGAGGGRASGEDRDCGGADRDRAGLPAGRCLAGPGGGTGRRSSEGCDGHAGARCARSRRRPNWTCCARRRS